MAELLKLQPEEGTVQVTLMGRGFGRCLNHDFGVEAAELAAKIRRPVQLVWSRSDDTRFGPPPVLGQRRQRGAGLLGPAQASTLHNMNAEPTAEQEADPRMLHGASWGAYDLPDAPPNIEAMYVPVDVHALLGVRPRSLP